MDLRLIVIFAALFSLIYIFKVKNKFAKIINGVSAVAIGVSLIPIPEISIDGFYILFACHIAAIIYVFSYDEFSNQKKILITVIAVFSILPSVLFFTPFSTEIWIGVLSIIPLIAFGYLLKNDVQSYKNEIGFLVIMVANALVTFIGTLQIYATVVKS